MPSFSFTPLMVSVMIFEYVFENLPFMSPRQPITFRELGNRRMKRGGLGLINKHI